MQENDCGCGTTIEETITLTENKNGTTTVTDTVTVRSYQTGPGLDIIHLDDVSDMGG